MKRRGYSMKPINKKKTMRKYVSHVITLIFKKKDQ